MAKVSRIALAAGCVLAASTIAACGSSSGGGTKVAANCKPAHPNLQTLTKGELQVLVYVSPPYTYQKGDTFSGVDQEIVSKIASEECLSLKEKPSSGAALIAGVQSKRADVAIGGIYRTPARAEVVNLTAPIYRDGMAVLSKDGADSLAQLKGKSVGVIQGSLWNGDLQKSLGSSVKIYQDFDGIVADMKNGRLDAAVLDGAEAAYHAKQVPGAKVAQMQPAPEIAASQSKSEVVFALTKGNDALTSAINSDIQALLNDGTVREALSHYGMDPSVAGPQS